MAAEPGMGHGPDGSMQIWRVHATADGESHIERVGVAAGRRPLPVIEVRAASFSPVVEDWHLAPGKLFVINTAGNIEAEVSDGARQAIGPGDLVYLEDLHGKGHLTQLLTPGACLFLHVAEDFDLLAWARD